MLMLVVPGRFGRDMLWIADTSRVKAAKMLVPKLVIPSLQDLYGQPYDARMLEWRQVGAADKVANIMHLLGPRSAEVGSVLEVGAGTGAVLTQLAAKGLGETLHGIEIGDSRLSAAPSAENISFSYYDGHRFDFPDNHFDLVFATHVLEHSVYERELLHEMSRVARKYVYVEVPLEAHMRTSQASLNVGLQIGHINVYDRNSFLLRLETSGLRVIAAQVFDSGFAAYKMRSGLPKAMLKFLVRRAALWSGIGPLALTYNCGALCEPAPKVDIA